MKQPTKQRGAYTTKQYGYRALSQQRVRSFIELAILGSIVAIAVHPAPIAFARIITIPVIYKNMRMNRILGVFYGLIVILLASNSMRDFRRR